MGSYKTIAYGANGGIGYAASGTSVSVPYPSGIAAGQMLVLQVLQATATDDIATPSGWTKLGSDSEGSGTTGANSAWFAKVASGSESGNLTVSRTGDVAIYFYGIIWRTGTGPKRDATAIQTTTPSSGNSSSASTQSITPSTDYCYVVAMVNEEDNRAIGTATGGNYAEQFEVSTTQGDDAAFSMNAYQQTTKANEPARTCSIAVGAPWMTLTIAIPAAYTWDLAGSIAATATVTGDLKVKRKLAGTIGATAALSGNVKGYWPKIGDWRWYADKSPPDTPLADENTLYTTTSLSTILRLRVEIVITGGKGTTDDGTIELEYSTNQSDWTTVASGGHWEWADGADTDGDALDTFLVADSGTRYGHFHESKDTQTEYPDDGDITEEDFAIKPTASVTTNTTYYFRVIDYYGAIPAPSATYGAGTRPQAKVTLGTTYSLAGSIAAQAAVTGNLKVIRKLAGSIAAQSAFVAAEGGKNLWPNADLESGIDDWNAVQGITISQDGTEKWQGSYALLCTPVPSYEWQTAQSDNKTALPSTQYTLSAYLWSQNAETNWLMSVYDQDAGWLGQAQPDTSAGTWLRFHIHFTTASDTTAIYLHLSRGSGTDTGLWRVDAVQLELGGTETAWENYGSGGGLQIIHAVWSLAGSVAAQATVTGALKKIQPLAGSIAATSTVTGNLSVHQLRQQAFRWRYNDGNETTATWQAALNANPSYLAVYQTHRLRFLIQEVGGVAGPSGTQNFMFQYRINSGTWTQLIRPWDSTISIQKGGMTADGDTTQQIGSGSFFTNNNGQIEDNNGDSYWKHPGTWTAGYECEVEVTFAMREFTDADVLEFRVVKPDGSALDGGYANTPSVEVQVGDHRLDEKHLRVFNDDGDEDASTPFSVKWTDSTSTANRITVELDTPYRIRWQLRENYGVDAGYDENLWNVQIQADVTGHGGWQQVSTTSDHVRLYDSTWVTNGEDSTQRLDTGGSFMSDNNGIRDTSNGVEWYTPPSGSNDINANSRWEVEFCVVFRSADLVAGDVGFLNLNKNASYLGPSGMPFYWVVGTIHDLAGSVAAQATVTGDLTVIEGGTTWDLAGSVAAQATVAGNAKAIRGLAASIAAQSTVAGDLVRIGRNLWSNANLEYGISDWEAKQSCAIYWSTAQAWEGTHSLFMDPTSQYWHLRSAYHPVAESTQYSFSFYIFPTTDITGGWAHVYDQDGNGISEVAYGACTGNTWTRITVNSGFTTGVGDTSIRVLIEAGDYNYDFYFDGFKLELGPSATPWKNGPLPVAGAIAAQAAAAGNAKVTRKLAGAIAAASTVTGNLELAEALWSLQGAVAAQATVSGNLKQTHKLAGSVAAQSSVTGNLRVHQVRQQSFRWRYNNHDEANATWRAAVNITPSTIYPLVAYRLRFLLQEYGGCDGSPSGNSFRLRARINSGTWQSVTSTSTYVRLTNSGLVNGSDTTQQLGTGSFISNNDGQIESSSPWACPSQITANSEVEVEYGVIFLADLSDSDDIDLKVEYDDGTQLDDYVNSVQVTLTHPAYERWDQQHFRFRNDDGSESSATWRGATDQDAYLASDTVYRLRFLVKERYNEARYDSEGNNVQLQYRLNAGTWTNVTTSSSVVKAVASQLVDNGDTTQQLGSGSYVVNNNAQIEDGNWYLGTHDPWYGQSECEVEFSIQVIDADTSPGDTVEFMLAGGNARIVFEQTVVPSATVGVLWDLAGSIAAQATLAGDLEVLTGEVVWDLAGSIAATSTLTGNAKVTRKLAGAIAATSALAGDLQLQHKTWDLAGSIAAQAALSGQCYVPKTYYMRADGTATTKATSTGPVTSASACMDLTNHNSYTFDPFDTIVVSDRGGDYRWDGTGYLSSIMEIASSGHAGGGEIHYEADGTPVFLGSYDLTTATYKWTASGSGTNEYYCEAAAGGDPGLVEGDCVWMDTVRLTEGTLGSLADHEWAWGNNDSLGYNTFYIRDNSGDPDTSGVAIEATQKGCVKGYSLEYVIVDGLTAKYGNGVSYDGGFRFDECSYVTLQNLEAHHNRGSGISLKGDHGVIDNCVASYNGAHNIVCGGSENNNATYMEVKNCTSHHSYTILFVPQPFDGYGIKFLWVDYSSIHNNTVYSNAVNGIDLDGNGTAPGCNHNDIYENEIYDNDIIGVMIELRSTNNRIYRNRIYDNGKATDWGNFQILFWHGCSDNEVFGNVVYRTNNDAGSNSLFHVGDYEATPSDGTKVYNNTFDGGGYAAKAFSIDSSYATAVDTKIKNNIFYGTTGAPIDIHASDETGFESDYNCFNRSGGTVIVRGSYEGHTKAQHCSGHSQDCNSVDDNPDFENAASHDYSLSDTSPCKNAGTNLGATYDDGLHYPSTWPDGVITLDQDSYGSAWEVGAYVYVGQFSGAIAAVSTLTGDAKITRKLAGSVSAQSSLAGALVRVKNLAGAVAAQSALAGNLEVQHKTWGLAGAVAAQSTLVGNLVESGMWSLAGTVSAASSFTGALKLQQRLQGAVSAFSSLVGNLQVQHKTWDLEGEIYARTLCPGNLRVIRKLVGDPIDEKVILDANLQIVHAVWRLQGAISEDEMLVVKGELTVTRKLAGAVAAQSALAGNLQTTHALWSLAGTVQAQGRLYGELINLSDIPKLLHPYNSWINVYSDKVTLTEIPLLIVSNGFHYHYASEVYVHQELEVDKSEHGHTVQNVTFALKYPITIQDVAHALSSEVVDLLNSLMIVNAHHYHSVMNVNIPYGPEAKEGMGLGDAVFGLKPTMKLPPYPLRQDELLKFCQQLYWQLQTHYIPQTDRIENMTMVGMEEQRPDPVGRRQLFYAFDTQSLWIDVTTEDPVTHHWSAEWFAIAAGTGTNEIHHTGLPDGDSQFLFQADFAGGAPGGCIVQYSAYMSYSSTVYAREIGVVQIAGFYPDYTITKITAPAVIASGGSATFTFTEESTTRDIKLYCTGVASGFTPASTGLSYTVWFGGPTTHVLYSDEG